MPSLPVIAIVGRPNVGKSSLLNALVGKRISIVQDTPGVTRDRVSVPLWVAGRFVELVDTGGIGFVDPDQLTEHIQHQIELAMARANLVLFVVDCQDGLTTADKEIAALLRRRNAKTVLVANKADGEKADLVLADFASMGFGMPIGISALHDRNLDLLLEAIQKNIDLRNAPKQIPQPQMLLAVVGKRNSGKSTLVNAVAKIYQDDEDRVIVSEVPGTTRDSIDVRFEKDGKALVVIDTAGVRKKRRMVGDDIAFYSFHRAQRSIRRADVVFMLIDGTQRISEPDRKLAAYIAQQYKPVALVLNKWDLTIQKTHKLYEKGKKPPPDDATLMDEYREYLAKELPHVNFAPVAFVTATQGRNVQAALDLAQHLHKQASTRLGTGQLNRVVRQVLQERTPSTSTGRKARVYYVTQVDVNPPTIVLFVNNPALIDQAYQRFMLNRFRELLPYPQVPISLIIRPRTEPGPVTSLDETLDGEDEPEKPRQASRRRAMRPPQQKPHRKSQAGGPRRGTRPG
jgi:GTP-binding protein